MVSINSKYHSLVETVARKYFNELEENSELQMKAWQILDQILTKHTKKSFDIIECNIQPLVNLLSFYENDEPNPEKIAECKELKKILNDSRK